MKHLPAEPFNHKEHKRLPFQEVARPVSSRYNRNVHDLLLASGLWTGFYTYAKLPEEHPMELRLQFNNDQDDEGDLLYYGYRYSCNAPILVAGSAATP